MNSQITNPQDKNNKVEMSLTVVDPGKSIKNLLNKPYASAYDTKALMLTQHGRLVIRVQMVNRFQAYKRPPTSRVHQTASNVTTWMSIQRNSGEPSVEETRLS